MRIDRLAVASAALIASTVLIGCGSDNNSNSPSNTGVGVSTPSLGSTLNSSSTGSTMGGSTGSSMDTTGTTLP
jgi:hypothetical protein